MATRRRFIRSAFAGAALGICFIAAAPAAENASGPPLALEATIALPGVAGRIDHMAIDLKRGRLIVAELGNNTVGVIDLATRKIIHRISGLREPQGVAYAERGDLVLAANAGDGSVRIFRGEDFAPLGSLPLGDDADNIRIDPRNGSAAVGYGDGGLAIIDAGSRSKIGNIALPAHPEGFQIDSESGRAFVNVPEKMQIIAVDLSSGRLTAAWRMRAAQNFPLALAPGTDLIAVVFRKPPLLALIDRETGAIRREIPACGDADDVFFDQKRQRFYISCGSGEEAAFQLEGTEIRRLPSIPTAPGARTSLFVPELDRLFIAKRAGLLSGEAAILVYRPIP
jgi:YVTN family beta-propeller protein